MASCGLPEGLCSPLIASVGLAVPGPGCRGAPSLTRPFLNILLRSAAPDPGEQGLGETALCLELELQSG